MDNGNGRTFEADLFTAGEILGLRLSRVGGDAADTYNKTIKFAEYLEFAYTAKLL
jgi:sporulation-control protein spo0M